MLVENGITKLLAIVLGGVCSAIVNGGVHPAFVSRRDKPHSLTIKKIPSR
jgi:hypothetical protein